MGPHRPRTKFIDVRKASLTCSQQRRHGRSQTRRMTRRLLELLGKILKETHGIVRDNENAEVLLTTRENKRP